MGTISTGVGLISGLNIQDIVTQLMALEARPLELIKARIETTQKQQTAFTELNARLMAARSAVYRLSQSSAFEVKTAASSNEDVLTATAGNKTPLDTYTFQVKSLVATHQLGDAIRRAPPTETQVGELFAAGELPAVVPGPGLVHRQAPALAEGEARERNPPRGGLHPHARGRAWLAAAGFRGLE